MNRNFLKGLLGEAATKEVIDSIMDENGKDIELEKGKATALQSEVDQLKATIKERDTQLENLKNSPDNSEALKQQITDLQTANETAKAEYEQKIHEIKVDNAIERALTAEKAKNLTAVKALLNLGEKVEFNEDGTIKGLAEQLKALKKSDDYLFAEGKVETQIKGAEPANSDPNPNQAGNKPTSEMTYEDFLAQYQN